MIKLAVLLLQVVQLLLRYRERARLLEEGEQRQIAKELARVVQVGSLAKRIREEVDSLDEDAVDAALRGDFRRS